MKAIKKINSGYGNIGVFDVPEPIPCDDEVKIKVAYAGICGTDMAIYNGTKIAPTPIIMGHEFSGVITAVGKNVTTFKPGDRIISETTKLCCNNCYYCATGNQSLCKERKALGQQVDGVFAEYCTQKASFVHHLPDSLSLKEAALAEPAACAYHAVYDINSVKSVDRCLIIGAGTMGLMIVQFLKALGAYTVITGINSSKTKLNIAKQLGADRTVNTQEEAISDIVLQETNGRGFDYVFECTGRVNGIQDSFITAKTGGTIVQVGTPPLDGVLLPSYANVMLKELNIRGTISQRYLNWDRVTSLMTRKLLNTLPLVSHVFTLDEAQIAFDTKDKIKALFSIHPELDKI